jgi:hypothetical protein
MSRRSCGRVFQREGQVFYGTDPGTWSPPNYPDIPPGNDNSPASCLDNNPSPNNRIYDFDAAGCHQTTASPEVIVRQRCNFMGFVVANLPSATVRISPIREWYTCVSCTRGPNGTTLLDPPDVEGDNDAGYGTIRLTWNLE